MFAQDFASWLTHKIFVYNNRAHKLDTAKGTIMATIDIVRDVLVENQDLDPEAITEDAVIEDLGIDSLDMVELICDIEDQCEVDFGEPSDLKTIGDIVAHIDSLK